MSSPKNRLSADNIEKNINKVNQYLTPKNIMNVNKSFQFKKEKAKKLLSLNDAKVLEIKGNKHLSSFHLVCEEDKYKQIEKKIQNKLLNISVKLMEDFKFDSFESKQQQSKITQIKSEYLGSITPKVKKISNNKLRKSKSSNKSHNLSFFKDIINEKYRRIKRNRILYDSFGEDESDRDLNNGNLGLNPKSIFIDIYDIFLILSTGFCLFYMPYRLAKTKMVINNNEYFILLMIDFSEIIFIVDLIFGFFRWYYNNEYKLVSNIYMIFSNYFYGDFLFDLIMAIPYYTIFRFQKMDKIGYNTLYNEDHYLLKILICFKAFKIFKLNKSKNNRVTFFFNRKFAKSYYLERIYQISNFILIICAIFNLIICFHIYMAELSYPNWIVSSNLQEKSFIEIYLSSLYFIIATMTSVGYGDIVCISFAETCFQIVLLSIGLVTYSWIISTVGDYIKNKSRASISYNRDMTKLEEIRVSYPNMPYKLYNKIQQHFQRMLTQNKKYEYNILVNSLPYYLQNSVLFQIHKNEINNFNFFKNCDNSDFILKVLTHFIPIFSKRNIVLVGEGEFFENIFFVKYGRLSLEAIIDLDNLKISIEKYLKYRFEEIEKIDDIIDQENSFQKSKVITQSFVKNENSKPNKLFTIINKQFENMEDISYLHESDIEQEIGKCDFQTENQDLYKGNIQYIHVLDLLKNEYFGEILMFLNIPNPLSLRVKSKRAELYVLRKKDAFNIRKDYPNIWQRINKKSIFNIKSLKSLTLDIIHRYCEMNGLIIKGKELVKLKRKRIYKKSYINNKDKIDNKIVSNENVKTKADSKLDLPKIIITPKKSPFKNINFNENKKNNEKEKIKYNNRQSIRLLQKIALNLSNENNKENLNESKLKERSKSFSSNKSKNRRTLSEKSDLSSSLSITLSELSQNKKQNKNSVGKNTNIIIQNNILQNSKNNINYKMTKSPIKIKPRIGGSIFSLASVNYKSFAQKNKRYSKKSQKLSNKNNLLALTGISTIKEFNTSYSKNLDFLKKESAINLQIKSYYNNINDIAEGNYINNTHLQSLIHKMVKYYIKINSIQKENKYSNNNFNYLKLFNKEILKSQIAEEEKFSISSEKNINSISYKRLLNEIKNKFEPNNPKENDFILSKEKYILDQKENESINSRNLLNSLNKENNKDNFSDYNNYCKSKGQFDKKNLKYVYKEKGVDKNIKMNKGLKREKSDENLYTKNMLNNKGNNIGEVNLNYVNNFCCIC